ncbi:conserved hypothetical protein [Histoplasma capsulatum var. duboisii H88]|uniref:Uncharacterized protein n=2 Tax=Ajellomyces capsulatus TaxID=5037 RepID=F0UJM4_AJEC8|nr:conserved hypothetical protein [Histoplasma capsulatum H143]EGC45767.1 conserved hypothetical protein [Histoplasma capsulatum var. duboisii H88]
MQARCRFLEHLPPQTRKYKYSGFQCLEEAVNEECRRFLDETRSPCIIFTDFPHPEIRNHEERFPGKVDYNPTLQLMILTTLFTPHEAATEVFGYRIAAKADEMGIFDALAFKGSTRIFLQGDLTNGRPSRWKWPSRNHESESNKMWYSGPTGWVATSALPFQSILKDGVAIFGVKSLGECLPESPSGTQIHSRNHEISRERWPTDMCDWG